MKNGIRRVNKPIKEYVKESPNEGGPTWKWAETGRFYRGGTFEEYRLLENLRLEVTGLYCLRAATHGRQHQLKSVTHGPTGEKRVQLLDAASQLARAESLAQYFRPEAAPAVGT